MDLGLIVALMMLKECIEFHEICFSTFKIIAKVKVCHNDDDDNNDKDYIAAEDTKVMTIPRLFFFEK